MVSSLTPQRRLAASLATIRGAAQQTEEGRRTCASCLPSTPRGPCGPTPTSRSSSHIAISTRTAGASLGASLAQTPLHLRRRFQNPKTSATTATSSSTESPSRPGDRPPWASFARMRSSRADSRPTYASPPAGTPCARTATRSTRPTSPGASGPSSTTASSSTRSFLPPTTAGRPARPTRSAPCSSSSTSSTRRRCAPAGTSASTRASRRSPRRSRRSAT